jgi:hypothetical protein
MREKGRVWIVALAGLLVLGVWAFGSSLPQMSSGKQMVPAAPAGPVSPPVNLTREDVGDVPEEPAPPPPVGFAPHAVLWDQPLSLANTAAYANQDFSDFPTYSCYAADDFTNASPWSLTAIFVPGDGWNGFSSLANATTLNWAIYADAGGVPDGDPSGGGNAPVWSLSLAPADAQVTITAGSGGNPSNVLLTLGTPAALPPGTWWFVFYPDMAFSTAGQYGRQPADTANGATGQWINPGGGFALGTAWQNWTVLGGTQQDQAFRLEGDLASCTVLYDNGPLVNLPAACSGMDASRLQTGLGMNTLGLGHQFLVGNRIADDFTLTAAAQIDQIDFFAYQTGAGTTSTMTGVYYQIWDGPPNDSGSTVVFGDLTTNRLTATEFSSIQRDSGTSPCANNRYIFRNTCSAGVNLPAGTYWIDWMADGSLSSGPWAPPITIDGQTTTGNALQYTTSSGAWNPALDSGTLTQQGFPFVLYTCAAGCPTITIAPAVLPPMQRGTPYSVTFTASGGTAPYSFSLTGTVPPGLIWDQVAATLSGTPTWAGDYEFTLDVMDADECTASQAYSVYSEPLYTLNFYDNLMRSQLCVDAVTGHYVWTNLSPWSAIYEGQGVSANGGTAFWTNPSDPTYIYATYDSRRKRARAYLTNATDGVYSALVDSNTTNNPPCGGTVLPPT